MGGSHFHVLGTETREKNSCKSNTGYASAAPPHLPRGERGCGPLEPDTVCVHLPPPRAGPLSGRTWQPQGWEGTRGLTLAEPLAGIQHQVLLGDLQLLHQPLILGPHLGDSLLAMLQNFQFRVEACDLLEGR